MPSCSDDFEDMLCDDCVPRGCSCNEEPLDGNYESTDPNNWVEVLDKDGRKFPCCEWFYDESGYEDNLN